MDEVDGKVANILGPEALIDKMEREADRQMDAERDAALYEIRALDADVATLRRHNRELQERCDALRADRLVALRQLDRARMLLRQTNDSLYKLRLELDK